ncbi:glycosyltransferase [Ascidiimonas sp. W6]|uniref:glycosyltransferase n=1 Tax=Ascidiimonas meishanensis TaxID=3128903 RepID=UPI0030EE1419
MAKSDKIKILFTIPNFDTAGSGKALLKVAAALDKNRFEAHIACMHSGGSFFKEVEKSGLPIHIIRYTIPMKPYFQGLKHCYRISLIFKKIAPDLIHSFHYAPDYSEALAAKMAGISWIYTKKNMNWGGKSANGWKLRSCIAKAIVVQNTDMKKEFFQRSNKTTLIPRGVDVMEFQPKEPLLSLRKQWKLAPDNLILMCVANLVPVKGIEVLLEAFENVATEFPQWTLMIVGDANNAYGESLKENVKSKGSIGNVIFTGKQTQVAAYLNMADVFALPTLNKGRKEGSPVAMLEAMACGTYVLGSAIAGIKDQLAIFPELLVEAGDIPQWTEALKNAFKQTKETRTEKGVALRRHVLQNYTITHEVQRCEQLYDQLVKK